MENITNSFYRTSTLMAEASLKDGKTILTDKFYTQPFKLMKPFHIKKDIMTLMMQSSSAGILAGDTQEITMTVNEGAKMEVTQQSFEKLHKMNGDAAKRDTTLSVKKNAFLKYFPLPTIPFFDSGFYATIDCDLEDDTSEFVLLDILTGGRIAYGEEFVYRTYNSHIKVRKGGKLIYNDNAQYTPAETNMKALGMYETYTHMANLLFFNMSDRAGDLEKIRFLIDEVAPRIEGGCSILQTGDTSVKLLGTSSQDLYDLCEKICKEVTGY